MSDKKQLDNTVRTQSWQPLVLGLAGGTLVYLLIAGPYFWYVAKYAWLTEQYPGVTAALGEHPWLGRVVSSWINWLSLLAFGGAVGLLWDRGRQLRLDEQAFSLKLLGADEDTLILPQDALECRKRIQLLPEAERRLTLVRLLSAGLQRARANWSSVDVGQAIQHQLELFAGGLDTSYSLVRYLAWTIPSLGFIGTVMGIGDAMQAFGATSDQSKIVSAATKHLHVAFDTTFVALFLSLILMYLVHRIQSAEECFLLRAGDWCLNRFVLRMHTQ